MGHREMHRSASAARKAISMNFNEIDIDSALCDLRVENFRSFIDHRKKKSMNDRVLFEDVRLNTHLMSCVRDACSCD